MTQSDTVGCLGQLIAWILEMIGTGRKPEPVVNDRPDFEVVQMYDAGDLSGLLRIMQDNSQFTRGLDAAEALARRGDSRGLDHLIAALRQPSAFLRAEAADSLSRIRNRRARVALKEYRKTLTSTTEPVPEKPKSPGSVAVEAPDLAAHKTHASGPPRGERPGFFTRAAPALLGSVGAVLTTPPLVCLTGFTLPTTTHGDAEGLAYLIVFALIALTPLAAVFGGLVGWITASIRQARHPGAPAHLAALLAGVSAGLLVTALGIAAYARTCGWDISCVM